ncbi:hypothetical protein B0O80DRAFT_259828 [Mortierella sp. GBAus27b]|nr:hypothetical protein B0O80DRAFT_259828 [Mortierella sp. GBAus27b]
MRHPSIHSIAIIGAPEDFIERSSLQTRNDDFSNLRHLGIDLSSLKKDITGIRALVSRAPLLSKLALGVSENEIAQVYIAIAEYQTYQITLNHALRISPPTSGLRQSTDTADNMKELFRLYDERIEILEPGRSELAGSIVDAFGSSRKELRVTDSGKLGGAQIKYLSTVVSWSELRSLEIDLRWEEGEERAQILESIQWKHMRRLTIQMDKGSTGTRAMKALVEGRNKEKGQVELDYFYLCSRSHDIVLSECASLCKSFVASTSIKELYLWVPMTPSDMESVLNSMDVTRLEVIYLRAFGYSSSEVDRVLDCLTNAHNLQIVVLPFYTPTQEQIQRMQQRGVTLRRV